MTTLEIALCCFSVVETLCSALWVMHLRKERRLMMMFCADRVIKAQAKYDEYDKALGDANVWINAR